MTAVRKPAARLIELAEQAVLACLGIEPDPVEGRRETGGERFDRVQLTPCERAPEADVEAKRRSLRVAAGPGCGPVADRPVAGVPGRDLTVREIEQRDQFARRRMEHVSRFVSGREAIDECEPEECLLLGSAARAQSELDEPGERGTHQERDDDEDDERNEIAGLRHLERVERRGEVVVERREGGERGSDPGRVAEHRRAHHREQQHRDRLGQIGVEADQHRGGETDEKQGQRTPQRGRRRTASANPRHGPAVQQPVQLRRPAHAAGAYCP